MRSLRIGGWLNVLAVSAGLLGAGVAWAEGPSQEDLAAEVKQLRAEVQELKAKQMTAADVDAIVRDVVADADRRSTLLGSEGFTAGYDKGKFLIQSADGAFVFNPWLQFQFRNVTSFRENGKSATDNNWDNGFELRRAKFGFSGNLFTPNFTYTAYWGSNRNTGTPVLEEFYGRYQFAEDWGVKAGQFKAPVTHEGLSSSKRLLAVEKSYMLYRLAFGEDYVQGVSLLYGGKTSPIHAEIAWTDGNNSANTNFQDSAVGSLPPILGGTGVGNYGAAARVEWLAFGNWSDYEQFTALDAKTNTLVLGAGAEYTQFGGSRTNTVNAPTTDMLIHTVDAQYINLAGFGLYGAYIGRYTSFNHAVANQNPDQIYDWGFLVQGSYLLNKNWELFARYDYTALDSMSAPGFFGSSNTSYAQVSRLSHHISEITVGVNYYIKGHAAKLTFDTVWLPEGAGINDDQTGVLGQTRDGNQVLLRGQFQLLI